MEGGEGDKESKKDLKSIFDKSKIVLDINNSLAESIN